VPRQLVCAKFALAEFGDSLPSLRQAEVGEMARWTRHGGSVRMKFLTVLSGDDPRTPEKGIDPPILPERKGLITEGKRGDI